MAKGEKRTPAKRQTSTTKGGARPMRGRKPVAATAPPGAPLGDGGPPGAPAPAAGNREHIIGIRSTRSFAIGGMRAAGEVAKIKLADHRPDDVVDIELEGGLRLVTTLADYLQDFPQVQARSAASLEAGELALPTVIPVGAKTRGVGDWIVQGLQILGVDLVGIDPAQAAGERAGEAVCAWYERRQLEKDPTTGRGEQKLWRCDTGDVFGLAEPGAIGANGGILLFIHGTASSTRGSFGELWTSRNAEIQSIRSALFKPYGGNVFAFEHCSLTQSPTANAIALVNELPVGATLDLITHSRGGLIGELLCRGGREGAAPFLPEEVDALFGEPSRDQERKNLLELSALLEKRKIKVRRFVRVACPARGTTLASGRLDRWLSILLNLIGQIPALKVSGFYDVFQEFVMALVKTRTNPDKLPGVEAMMPDAPLINLLNRPEVRVSADLHVIAGDIEGGGIWRKLGILLTDLFYAFEDHDLVVNTLAMYGGAERTGGARYVFAQGPEVFHFNYFQYAPTARKLVDALQEKPEDDGFKPFSPQLKHTSRGAAPRGAAPTKPIMFLLPGIMGSHLKVNGKRIWLDFFALAGGGLEQLAIDAPGVVADEPIGSAYGDLIDFLANHYEVVPFAYDWRLSLQQEAARLAAAIDARLRDAEARQQPLSIVAHSMGGLLARVMIALHPDLWQRMLKHEQSRLIMLGTPNGGSYVIPRMLVGRESIVMGLALADLAHSQHELLDIISRYPGALEMLPARDGEYDFFDARDWQRLRNEDSSNRWAIPPAETLTAARAVRALLDRPTPNSERLRYVAGCAPQTPCRMIVGVRPQPVLPPDWTSVPPKVDPIQFEATDRGDGRVLWDTGILHDVKTWYMDAAHGDMADHEPAFPAILDLLQSGDTDRLRTSAPAAGERGAVAAPAEERELMRAPRVEVFPHEDVLEAAALGRGARKAGRTSPRVRVTVAHGNLAFARSVVAVGHYQGDTIISAEEQIDRKLKGRLTRRNLLGLYPGPLNTSEVFLESDGAFPGAIVVGLGKVGELTPGTLAHTFSRALVAYALARLEPGCGGDGAANACIEASISSLLIGTTAGGLTIRDAVAALLRGVQRANDRLRQAGLEERIRFAAIEFIELYQDRAIEATGKLGEALRDPDLDGEFGLDAEIVTLDGGRRRVTYEEPQGWWSRLQIVAEPDGRLRFTALTDRARAEVSLLPTQRALVDQFIAKAIGKTGSDDRVASTLFELLLPNELKEHSRERRNVVLVLNDAAAAYPWELIHDGLSGRAEGETVDERHAPLSVQAGMLRQRETEDYRRRVNASLERSMLVIGDPDLSDPPSPQMVSLFPKLDGARDEAQYVIGFGIRKAYAVSQVIRGRADEIVRELFARPYRILHLAGHGVYQFVPLRDAQGGAVMRLDEGQGGEGDSNAARPVSGMVIGCRTEYTVPGEPRTRYVLLTPAEIEQMRFVPELVFINCCFGGMDRDDVDAVTRADRHRLAANISTQLIRMGVRAVVCAGWAVDDAAASTFASTFYERMLEGESFGRAVQQARMRTYMEHPGVNTWGAYQCYGDPDFQLVADGGAGREGAGPGPYFAREELVVELDNVSQDAMTCDSEDKVERLRKRVRQIHGRVSVHWRTSGTISAALGRAYGELDEFKSAIDCYEASLKAEKADIPLATIEQLANLKARWAVQLHRESSAGKGERRKPGSAAAETPPSPPSPSMLVKQALHHLDWLLKLGATAERYRLLGSAYKRASLIAATPAERIASLRQMKASYSEAHRIALTDQSGPEEEKKPDSYALTNWLTARWLLSLVDKVPDRREPDERPAAIRQDANTLLARVEADKEGTGADRSFWSLSTAGDCLNVRCVIGGTLDAHQQNVISAYLAAKERAVSPRQWRSVIEHFDFLIESVAALGQQAKDAQCAQELLVSLSRIRSELERAS